MFVRYVVKSRFLVKRREESLIINVKRIVKYCNEISFIWVYFL